MDRVMPCIPLGQGKATEMKAGKTMKGRNWNKM